MIVEQEFIQITCGECGVVFMLTREHQRKLVEEKRTFYCPNGHARINKENEADRLRKQLDETRRDLAMQIVKTNERRWERDQKDLRIRSLKGVITKMRNKEARHG